MKEGRREGGHVFICVGVIKTKNKKRKEKREGKYEKGEKHDRLRA